ncbi:MAG: nicotinate phosphoribosyltransferase [Caldithrix sp.]|nr:nicotinate phosphoribosyltransferase [Caldithrix sp.]
MKGFELMEITNATDSLLVDLYELTMAAGYFEQNYNPWVCFELFIRDLPPNRNFLIAAGLEQVINYVTHLSFNQDQIEYLRSLSNFKYISDDFFRYLHNFSFSGNLYGVPEGTVVFNDEPLIQVEAPLLEAQILETYLLSAINFQTMVASKSARIYLAATSDGKKQRGVMEFGSRRAHGPQAGVLAARASYIGGFIGTSNVLAGKLYQIPVYGTTAHSWTMAFNDEITAFQRNYEIYKEDTIFLVDTYDTETGILNALKVSLDFKGIRIDSGNLIEEAKKARRILDEQGLDKIMILLSGDLNEYKIDEMIQEGTPVNAFGVGTQVATSYDAPTLQGVYKLVELTDEKGTHYRAKFSPDKISYPGRKQVWRFFDKNSIMNHDLIALNDEDFSSEAESLIQCQIENGQRVQKQVSLVSIQQRTKKNLSMLPESLKHLRSDHPYSIKVSKTLKTLLNQLQNQVQNITHD